MSASTPWWYSGAAPQEGAHRAEGSPEPAEPDRETRARFDLAGLASGAQQLVDLARQALLAPHAGHEDPRDHPECMLCRTMSALGEVRAGPERAAPGPGVEWIALEPPQR